jgi:hypothetical protein
MISNASSGTQRASAASSPATGSPDCQRHSTAIRMKWRRSAPASSRS